MDRTPIQPFDTRLLVKVGIEAIFEDSTKAEGGFQLMIDLCPEDRGGSIGRVEPREMPFKGQSKSERTLCTCCRTNSQTKEKNRENCFH